MPDLLIELFSEEIPARMQSRARDDLKRLVTDGLVEAGLTYASAGAFSTPRRLTLTIEGLTAHSPTTREERKGPRTDAPEKALDGFLRSTGLTRAQLEARDDKKGQVWFATIEKPGRPAAGIVAEVLETTIRNFPWPKSMRWGAGSLRWVRPLHSIICLLSDESGAAIVPLTIEGITAGDSTRGHRFMAPDAFTVTGFSDYAAKLRRARVMLDPAERESAIHQQADNLAFARGWEIVPDDGLLAEVAGLVEWPVPLMGVIEERFLDLPPEVLQTSMKEHQKFFSARNPKTGRIEGFVTVANIETADDGATILAGNQRVLAARLSDAAFFWDNDLREAKAGMETWADGLKSVTFHNKLGSQADRIARIAALAREIAPLVGADADQAEQAARLAKLDLRSAMVGEFPELQGIMGRYYALAANHPEPVADAARDHYSPLGPSDEVPTAPVSVAVALADKLDTLTGFWAIDEKPTGSKDPFALRRAALGVIRLVQSSNTPIPLIPIVYEAYLACLAQEQARTDKTLFICAYSTTENEQFVHAASVDGLRFSGKGVRKHLSEESGSQWLLTNLDWDDPVKAFTNNRSENVEFPNFSTYTASVEGSQLEATYPSLNNIVGGVLSFLHDRLKVHLRDQGIRHDIIDAVLAQPGNDDLVLVVNRATALNDMLQTEDGKNLTQGLKRAGNILSQAEEKDGVEYSFGADAKFADTDEERALFAALDTADPAIRQAIADEDFPAAMSAIAALRTPIDAFFEAVQVNSDNQIQRRNRLNLLSRIREAGRQIADFTRIEG
ncbi:glycyl-tRNA synthetase beta chain [Paracoccus alcaliphilus]|uniref:Glycine--tRNA ligase beta subunit n=1 Tax=Paracoccus alcaliphilus TaxID=34002 RepID=A0A1H8INJ8_9RHOB|nr:glycine--tRNA ligase subunit beta [Paracoccus alcaliphilus]WCR17813.1 glycine--tRNA ligase subunit beta [Paracoccus alcaliphilus]SEN69962.1 glycyl-tRNA synthetase beta chain [Paracoccus alcaliphilus]